MASVTDYTKTRINDSSDWSNVNGRDVAAQILIQGLESARVRKRRTLRQWVEEEVIIPDGPYKGERFKVSRQPFTGLLFDAIDSGDWVEYFVCGPSQTGKTLAAHVLPSLYTVSELRKNFAVAVPDMRMAQNKWEIDFLPTVIASPSLSLLRPNRGAGSQGGAIKDSITFQNGVVLKFMTAGGDDTQRAGFTAEGGVFVTEAARFSAGGENSVEADPLDQLRARMQAVPRRRRRLVVEGTATISEELPYSGRELSTRSRIVLPCPKCGHWVTPEREHLQGWQAAENEFEAADKAYFCCPDCSQPWTEDERRLANLAGRLLHHGQSIDERGEIIGQPPKTERLWFRWSMANNLLLSAGDVAVDEWKAAQIDKETEAAINAEKKLSQFVWALPYVPTSLGLDPLTSHRVASRQDQYPRGVCPEDTTWITVGVDLGKYFGHFVVIAWRKGGRGHVVDYGIFDVPTKKNAEDPNGFDVKVAVQKALQALHERFETQGWTIRGRGEVMLADKVLIDCNWETDAVQEFMRSVNGGVARASDVWVCCQGQGVGQHERRKYAQPTRAGGQVLAIGSRYFVTRFPKERVHVVQLDTDHWKSWIHDRLRGKVGERGSLELFASSVKEHNTYTKHLTNEQLVEKPVPGFGVLHVWENKAQKANHYFDSTSYACVAGHMCGFRVLDEGGEEAAAGGAGPTLDDVAGMGGVGAEESQAESGPLLPDGRSFFEGVSNEEWGPTWQG